MQTGVAKFIKELAKAALPAPVWRLGLRIQRCCSGYTWRLPPRLRPLPAAASPQLALLHRAWELAAGSEADLFRACYYGIDLEGFPLPGERPWHPRWRLFNRNVSWRGARVLELGCNVGLLSTFALLEGAQDALGVESNSVLLEANHLVQRAFRVSYRTIRCNFDDPNPWEEELAAFRPTIVTALSVLNWVRQKERFLKFLSRFGLVLFEGHDRDAVERRRLAQVGFTDVTAVGRSELNRAVFLARKSGEGPST